MFFSQKSARKVKEAHGVFGRNARRGVRVRVVQFRMKTGEPFYVKRFGALSAEGDGGHVGAVRLEQKARKRHRASHFS